MYVLAIGSTVPMASVGEKLAGNKNDYLAIDSSKLFINDAMHFQTSMFMISMLITHLKGKGRQYILHADPVCLYYII